MATKKTRKARKTTDRWMAEAVVAGIIAIMAGVVAMVVGIPSVGAFATGVFLGAVVVLDGT